MSEKLLGFEIVSFRESVVLLFLLFAITCYFYAIPYIFELSTFIVKLVSSIPGQTSKRKCENISSAFSPQQISGKNSQSE